MKIGTIYDITFSTNRADTGALSDADSTPIVRVTENGTNLAYLPTVSSLSTGVYLVSIDTSLANGFEVGKRYSVYCTATVNTIDGATGLDSFTVDTRNIDDVLPTASYTTPPTVGEMRTELTPELALINLNLDAKVSEAGGGLTEEQNTKLFSLENSTGGGGFSSQAIQTSISNAKREIIEKMEEMPSKIPQVSLENIETSLSEIDSHNSLAKTEIINTIKSESNEVCSDIIRKTKELKEDNITTRNLVRQKTKKLDENVSKLADRQDKTDKMIEDEADEIESEIEKILNEEADMIENEIYNKEADEIEKDITNQSNDGNSESNS